MNRYRVLAALAATSLLAACSSTVPGHPDASGVAHHSTLGLQQPAAAPAQERGVTDAPTSSSPSAPDGASPTSSPVEDPPSSAPTASPTRDTSSPADGGPTPQGQPSIDTFVGDWYGHGRSLTVDRAGNVRIDFRTYQWCSATVTTACDRQQGNSIVDGGHVAGRITYVRNDTTVTVTVDSSSDPGDFPVAPFKLGYDRAHDAVAGFTGQFDGVPFCGAHAPDGYCGA